MSEPLQEPSGRNTDEWAAEMERLVSQVHEWKEATYQRLKAEHEARYGEQLPLMDAEVEGVKMADVRQYLLKLNAIETVLEQINATRTDLYKQMREAGLPDKTIRSALKIARATHKRDTSRAVLDACVAVALSLMPDDEEPEHDTRDFNAETGEVYE